MGQMMREFWEEEEEGVNDEGVLGGGNCGSNDEEFWEEGRGS